MSPLQQKTYVLLLGRKGESGEFSFSAASQLSSPLNNPYAKVVYFEVTYSDPLHLPQHLRGCFLST